LKIIKPKVGLPGWDRVLGAFREQAKGFEGKSRRTPERQQMGIDQDLESGVIE
jgi:hypothetical protein